MKKSLLPFKSTIGQWGAVAGINEFGSQLAEFAASDKPLSNEIRSLQCSPRFKFP